ncbi:hypothetical protein QE152_g19130 [Popillia japonica]|uniref:Uncharacterized protein n=1 Tax=Popillia japonica TaxID=7064 RepID=A0AAW1L1P5_POPJA
MLTEDSVDEDSEMEEEHAIEDSLEIDVSKPTKLEVENAVRHMRSNKAAGVDEIPSELWKADIRKTTDHTTTVATQQPPIILVKRLDHISPVPMIKKVAAARKNFRAVDEVLNSPENIINLRNRKR